MSNENGHLVANTDGQVGMSDIKPSSAPSVAVRPHLPHLGGGWKHLVAGTVAGAVPIALLHPLDTIKTRMQIQGQWGASTAPQYLSAPNSENHPQI